MFRNSVLKLVAPVVLLGLGEGCTAHARASAQVNTSVEADERKYEVAEQETPAPPTGTRPAPAQLVSAPAPADRTFFLGVSHDLSLAPAARRAACRCLAVGYGPPTDPKFAWQEAPPKVEPGTMAVAIAADGVPCSSPGYAPLRASISAVERSGDDIVLIVENVREGLPTVHGALVASPSGKSTLVVRARRGAPYGAPASGGTGPCRLALE